MRLSWVIAVAASIGAVSIAAADDAATPNFEITTKRSADRATVTVEADQTVIAVRSPSGIGEATISRQSPKWPEHVTLRLHLNGLESLRLSNGKTTLNVAVASHGQPPRVRVWKNEEENTPLAPKARYWVDVRMFDKTGNPTTSIPLDGGRFELKLPRAFFDDDPKSITVRWIDFYR